MLTKNQQLLEACFVSPESARECRDAFVDIVMLKLEEAAKTEVVMQTEGTPDVQ